MIIKCNTLALVTGLASLSMISYTMESKITDLSNQNSTLKKVPFKYYSPTPEEKNNLKVVAEGQYTVFNTTDDCAVVGPLSPCQLIRLSNGGKTVIGHLVCTANLSTLLKAAKDEFHGLNLADTIGNVYTTKHPDYIKKAIQTREGLISRQDMCQGRSQKEEVKKIKDAIINALDIVDRAHIQAQTFNPKHYTYEICYVFLKHTDHIIHLFSINPIEENIYNQNENLSLSKRSKAFDRERLKRHNNSPYLLQLADQPLSPNLYGKFPFVKI